MIEKPKKLNVTSHKEMTQFKIALVGDQQAGKSCFMSQYL
jgi:GTPase SAR1 family protein